MSQVIAASYTQKLVPAVLGCRQQPYECAAEIFGAKNVLPLELMELTGDDSHEALDFYAGVYQNALPQPASEEVRIQFCNSESVEDIEKWLRDSWEFNHIDSMRTKYNPFIQTENFVLNSSEEFFVTDSSSFEDVSSEETSISSEKESEIVIQKWHLGYLNEPIQTRNDITNIIDVPTNSLDTVDSSDHNNKITGSSKKNGRENCIDEVANSVLSYELSQLAEPRNEVREIIISGKSTTSIESQISCLEEKATGLTSNDHHSKLGNEQESLKTTQSSNDGGNSQPSRKACTRMPSDSIKQKIDLDHPPVRTKITNPQIKSENSHETSDSKYFTETILAEEDSDITNILEKSGITNAILKNSKKRGQSSDWHCCLGECDRSFSKLSDLKTHLLSHIGIRPFKCDHDGCSWAFYTEFKLKRHKETHLKKKDFKCLVPGCERRFTTIYNLTSHQKLHLRPEKLTCEVAGCNAKFQTKRASELHMKIHDASFAPYVCKFENCGKRFYTNNTLISHQRSHTHSQSELICSWDGCGKVFDLPCRLKTHMRSHTGTKPYACTFKGCKWAFSTSSKLSRHQRKHTNDRKFVCDVGECGKAFMRPDHLKEHKLTHSLRRLFQCHICPSAFNAKSSLYVHLKKHKNKELANVFQSQSKNKSNEKKSKSKKDEISCCRVQPIRFLKNKIKNRGNVTELSSDQLLMGDYCHLDPGTKICCHEVSGKYVLVNSCSTDSHTGNNVSKLSATAIGQVIEEHATSLQKSPELKKSRSGKPKMSTTDCERDPVQGQSKLRRASKGKLTVQNYSKQAKSDDSSSSSAVREQNKTNSRATTLNEGSARTAFTKEVILNFKPSKVSTVPNVQDRNVIMKNLSSIETNGLSDELSSLYPQGDMDLPEYQLLILDSNIDGDVDIPDFGFVIS
ncbi:hypothetical protein QAD02_001651 [Eretmocerus hayati]|uniref:Uncharacterized protein n=1 Tax=Eretmocerus hayati TaxID=131215 RepID=A0ACC2NJI4_9HYME|nr:hypothetical protein QAD02_001651 [Eretmocerus hayati]